MRSSVGQTRSALYAAARLLGWVRAAQRGRLPQRAANVLMGRAAARIMRRLWR